MAAITVDKVTRQPNPRGAIIAKQVALYAAMTLFGLLMLGPFILAIFGAFKNSVEVNAYPPTLLPQVWHPENFLDVARLFPMFPRWFVNSVGLSAAVTVLNVFFCALAGYAFARLNFPGRTVLFLAVLATLMIPLQVTLIPKFIIMKQFGLINTYPGVILPNISTRRHRRGHQGDVIHAGDPATLRPGADLARHLQLPGPVERLPLAARRPQRPDALHPAVGHRRVRR